MIIEFTNAVPPKGHSAISVAIVVASCAFFFIPTSLIVLGYLSSQPTGSLISPLPQGVLSNQNTNPSPTATPLIAAPKDDDTSTKSSVLSESASNITDKTATISAGLSEVAVQDPDINVTSQIYLSSRPDDKSIYSVKSKQEGQMVITANTPFDTVRYVDYHIVNP